MSTLILIPTQVEQRVLEPLLRAARRPGDSIELCGFGLIAAAARTSFLLARSQPDRVVLVGIAGSLNSDATIGSALTFASVACDGIGAGSGDAHISAGDMGWRQWDQIADRLPLQPAMPSCGELLSVTAASATASEVARRRQRFPQAVAEDMEAFGVAMACHMANVPLEVIRGLSNRAGDRNTADWEVTDALHAAAVLARETL